MHKKRVVNPGRNSSIYILDSPAPATKKGQKNNVKAVRRFDQGFIVRRGQVNFLTRAKADRYARRASEAIQADVELIETRHGWAYRRKEED